MAARVSVDMALLQFGDKMARHANDHDAERGHVTADELLIRTLELLVGHGRHRKRVDRIIEEWGKVEKWYA